MWILVCIYRRFSCNLELEHTEMPSTQWYSLLRLVPIMYDSIIITYYSATQTISLLAPTEYTLESVTNKTQYVNYTVIEDHFHSHLSNISVTIYLSICCLPPLLTTHFSSLCSHPSSPSIPSLSAQTLFHLPSILLTDI